MGENWFRVLALFVSPTIIGVAVLVSVLTGTLISSEVENSEVVSSVALVVAGALILGSTGLYIREPEKYERLQKTNAEQLRALVETQQALVAQAQKAAAKALEESSETRP